jgi:branched-chain amino acid transport system ATP-binding protein
MNNNIMLAVNNLEIVYSDVILALRGISLQVPEQGRVALLGANGAGKSTALRAISNILDSQDGEIEAGTIEFLGTRIEGMAPQKIVRMGISQVPEGRGIFPDLTVYENLDVGGFTQNDRKALSRDSDNVFHYFPILKERRNQRAGFLSGGEQQMLAIGRAMMSHPKLLMLDEPSLGLAPLVTRDIFKIILSINREDQAAILLVEQNAYIALMVTQYCYILENGKIVMDGESAKLKENQDVKEFYLGMTEEAKKKKFSEIKHYKRRKRWVT